MSLQDLSTISPRYKHNIGLEVISYIQWSRIKNSLKFSYNKQSGKAVTSAMLKRALRAGVPGVIWRGEWLDITFKLFYPYFVDELFVVTKEVK